MMSPETIASCFATIIYGPADENEPVLERSPRIFTNRLLAIALFILSWLHAPAASDSKFLKISPIA
jgi:hypothetical protein